VISGVIKDMYPPDLETYPEWLKKIHARYMKKKLWRYANWYDYLKDILDARKK